MATRKQIKARGPEPACPFFVERTPYYIGCRSAIDGARYRLTFARGSKYKQQHDTHFRIFCCWRWRCCEHAQALRAKLLEEIRNGKKPKMQPGGRRIRRWSL